MKKKKSITKEENSLLAPPLWQGLCPRTPFKKQCHSEGVRSSTEEYLWAKIISSFWALAKNLMECRLLSGRSVACGSGWRRLWRFFNFLVILNPLVRWRISTSLVFAQWDPSPAAQDDTRNGDSGWQNIFYASILLSYFSDLKWAYLRAF